MATVVDEHLSDAKLAVHGLALIARPLSLPADRDGCVPEVAHRHVVPDQ